MDSVERMLERDPNAGLDSLLDTMTNAIGILIVVLAVSYLALQDSVNRVIRLEPTPARSSVEQLRDLRAEANLLDRTVDHSRTEWQAVHRSSQYDHMRQQSIREKIGSLSSRLGPKTVGAMDARDIARQLAKDQSTLAQLTEEIGQLERRVKHAQQAVQLQRSLPKPKVTIARVPDPIPAPRDAQPLAFLCRYGRVVYYSTEEMLRHLNQGIAESLKASTTSARFEVRHLQQITSHFDLHEIGQDGLRWRIRVVQRIDTLGDTYRDVRAVLEWTSFDIGDDLDRLQTNESRHREILSKAAGSKAYVKYYVWGDSFAEYAVSREIADGLGLPAGWVAKEGDAEYQLELMSTRTYRGAPAVDTVQQTFDRTPIPRIGFGIGMGGAPSLGGAGGSPSFGVVGASPGTDYVD